MDKCWQNRPRFRWIVIYPVDSVIHPLNNWGLTCKKISAWLTVTCKRGYWVGFFLNTFSFYSQLQIYLNRQPNPRKRLLVPCSLVPPNPKCYVCAAKPEVRKEKQTWIFKAMLSAEMIKMLLLYVILIELNVETNYTCMSCTIILNFQVHCL